MFKQFLLFAFISFSFVVNNYSQQASDKQIQIGLDKIYNFNWDEGFRIFNSIIKKNPTDPRGYHYKSIIFLWHYLGNLNEV